MNTAADAPTDPLATSSSVLLSDAQRSAVARLTEALGADHVVTGRAELLDHGHDTGVDDSPALALALVLPTSTEEVAAVMAIANDLVIPVVPQGTRTGVVGGADAVPGAILLDLTLMNRILRIDVDDQLVTVQPGVITGDLAAAVREQGLFYPVDPGSVHISSIGGNIVTNAGGMRCVKYGVTGDSVRSLTVVLADGTVVRTGHDSVKGVAGLDLTSLIVGSEGTLGIVTQATLALRPLPGEAAGAAALFPTLEDALAAAAETASNARRPSALEMLDQRTIQAINHFNPNAKLPDDVAAMLIVESDEIGRATEDVAEYQRIFESHHAVRIDLARNAAEVDALLEIRRQLHPALYAEFGTLLTEDIAVPRGRLLKLLRVIEQAAAETGAPVATGGHVGDGNLHPIVGYVAGDADSLARAHRAYEQILTRTIELGGTITGEHGVGTLKRSALGTEFSSELLALQIRVKAAFDPRGILNPGKKL
ncbi:MULTISPECIES: FAD-binding oxidoreductase [unclassified Pseudoclavibacter]|uniref:FAD-binding oxidoreductase n=1 Tax=unclassified Pseudoclavibacter TaxID=2615177 RepID=UPI0013012222|nr:MULTISPECIES: FAD-linked oxidase C-terminal domain-containing protein [unclassified Pseudoclavibacter]KAB1658270.1 FAD-binding protein [Pseudoclavibacter sp. CFCC 11306]KAB1661821.1 FAD-binding protein [Pseudoclavibacter sp. CFCC 13796]KAB1663458.1 FAD-binding protein [Pseudoclavibacter sp. CFCC 13611]